MNNITKREKEILDCLKKDPMISQDELAARMNISRSAAAVHISNLMKKGYILGRGYIFDERSGVVVIGKTWLEVCSDPLKTSGKVDVSYQGLGYRLALELLKFGVEPILLTVLGQDEIGDQMHNHLLQKGIKVQHIIRSKDFPTAKRVIVRNGEQTISSVEEMDVIECINERYFASKEDIIKNTRVLLVDGTLSLPQVKYLAEKIKQYNIMSSIAGRPLVWYKEKGFFSYSEMFLVCQCQELEILAGHTLGTEPEGYFPICRNIIEEGLRALVVMMGQQGLILATKEEIVCLPNTPLQPVQSDLSINAGIAGGLASGLGFRLAIRRAMGSRTTGETLPGKFKIKKTTNNYLL